PAVFVRDTLHHLTAGLDVETARCSYRHAAQVDSSLLARRRHIGAHQITGLESSHSLAAQEIASRKAILVQSGSLVATAPGARHLQGGFAPGFDGVHTPDAGSIKSMGLWHAKLAAVVLRTPAGCELDRKSTRLNSSH